VCHEQARGRTANGDEAGKAHRDKAGTTSSTTSSPQEIEGGGRRLERRRGLRQQPGDDTIDLAGPGVAREVVGSVR
jgi:hypothetical protein